MADVVSSLAAFEERNVFEPLQSLNDESIPDVESPEEILDRIERQTSELAVKQSQETSPEEDTYTIKKRSFQEGELDDSWTIVASRRSRRNSRIATPISPSSSEDETPQGKPSEKPNRKWKRSIVVLGTAAAVGLVSFLLNRRFRRNKH